MATRARGKGEWRGKLLYGAQKQLCIAPFYPPLPDRSPLQPQSRAQQGHAQTRPFLKTSISPIRTHLPLQLQAQAKQGHA